MKKIIISSIIFILFFCFLIPNKVSADGMMILPDPYSDRWDYSHEIEQKAFINYENGVQKMIISVGYEKTDGNSLMWIFPVPSQPENVAIDVLKILPQLNGEEISLTAKSNLNSIRESLSATQIYPIPFLFVMRNTRYSSTGSGMDLSSSLGGKSFKAIERDVVVYEHIEKEGITSEILTAKTSNGLFEYLSEQGLNVNSNSIPILDTYIGKDFSFIASWLDESNVSDESLSSSITDINYSSKEKGIFITFPTDELYFPLMPTSVYGSEIVPATIRILGYTSPKIFDEIESFTEVKYYISNDHDFSEQKSFYNGDDEVIKYTKIELNSPSKYFLDDLWIAEKTPLKTSLISFLARYNWVSGIILLVISSVLTALIVGSIIFKDLDKKFRKLFFLGISNCFSILFLIISLSLTRTKKDAVKMKEILDDMKLKRYVLRGRIATILSFLFLLSLLISIPFFISIFSSFTPIFYSLSEFIPILVTIGIAISVGILKKKKKEDKVSVDILKSNNYSTWTFLPKDGRKWVFLPIYSITFLLVVLGLTKLIESLL